MSPMLQFPSNNIRAVTYVDMTSLFTTSLLSVVVAVVLRPGRVQKVAESLFAKYIRIALATFASSMIRLAMMWLA
jgi:hypothetical protein